MKQYIDEVATLQGTTSVDIAQKIKGGQTFKTRHGASVSLINDRRMGQYIVARDPVGNIIDMLDPRQISGGRRKKRRNTKKARRTSSSFHPKELSLFYTFDKNKYIFNRILFNLCGRLRMTD